MGNQERTYTDVLQDIFNLPKEWAKALFSIEYCLTAHSISKDSNDKKRRLKSKWLQNWEKSIDNQFNTTPSDQPFSLIRNELALKEFLKQLSRDTEQKSHAYSIIIEALFFAPYFPLALSSKADDKNSKIKLKYKTDIDYLASFASILNIDRDLLKMFQKRFTKAYMSISGKKQVALLTGLAAGVLIVISAGMMAPKVILMCAAPGLTGAAAISSGLATLGGGAIAAGGTGMMGGTVVLVTTGGILGVAGGTTVGALAASSPAVAAILAAKLEVYFRVVIDILKDKEKARSIIRGQESFIKTLLDQLEKDPKLAEKDRQKYKALKKAIKFMQRARTRNENALLKLT